MNKRKWHNGTYGRSATMPYKSEAQRKWANSPSGIKAMGKSEVEKWNEESKGMQDAERSYRGMGRINQENVNSVLYNILEDARRSDKESVIIDRLKEAKEILRKFPYGGSESVSSFGTIKSKLNEAERKLMQMQEKGDKVKDMGKTKVRDNSFDKLAEQYTEGANNGDGLKVGQTFRINSDDLSDRVLDVFLYSSGIKYDARRERGGYVAIKKVKDSEYTNDTDYKAELLSQGYKLYKTSMARGYMSRKDTNGVKNPYKGKYGEGFTVETPRNDTTQYHNISYYIKDSAIVTDSVSELEKFMLKTLDTLEEMEQKINSRQPETDANGIIIYKKDIMDAYNKFNGSRDKVEATGHIKRMEQALDKMRGAIETNEDNEEYQKMVRLLDSAKTKASRL